jgi:hypothetical protein
MNGNNARNLSNSSILDEPEFKGTPERNLLMAVLERAILDYVSQHEKDSQEAGAWILDVENEAVFSFNWVCRELDLDPIKVADDIETLPKRTNKHIAPWYTKNHVQEETAIAA